MVSILRYKLFLLCLLLLLNGIALAQPGEKGTVVKNTQPLPTLGNTWAVVIGISDYQNIQKLNFADRDAQAFYQYLRTPQVNVPEKNIRMILNKEATSVNIFGALDWLLESVKENDRVIFYFSGHGDVEKKTIYQNGFLLASDAPVAAYMSKGTVSVKFLQDYLETYVAANKAKQVLLVVDACRSGKLAGGMDGIKLTMQALGKSWNGQITKILSAQEGEISLEDVKWGGGRGVFSYYLMKGIQGLANRNTDNIITAGELLAYLPFAVADETTSTQNPKIEGDPRTPLFTFDEVLLADAKKTDLKTNGPLLAANKGTASTYTATVNNNFIKYQALVTKGWLLWGQTEKDTLNAALHYYKKLINHPQARELHATLKSSFLAALQKNAQNNLDHYLKGKNSEAIKDRRGIMEITYAANLTDKNHLLHNYVNARALFFQSLIIKDLKKAIQTLKKALSYENDAAYVINRIGLCFADLHQRDSAIAYYNKALALAPSWSYPYNNLAIEYWEAGEYPKAIANSEEAIKHAPDNYSPYNVLGNVYHDQGKYQDAITNYRKSIQLGPTATSYPYNGLGNTFYDLDQIDSAKVYYKKAIAVDSTDNSPYNGLGNVYSSENKIDSAKIYYRKSMKFEPKDHHPIRNLADILIQESKFNEAKKLLLAGLELEGGKPDLYNSLGDLFNASQNLDSALFYYKKTMSIDPKHPNGTDNVGYIFGKMGKPDSAIKYFKLAEQINPTDDYALTRLAKLYTGKGEVKLALQYYDKLIKLKPTDEELYHTAGHLQPDSVKMFAYYLKALELDEMESKSHLQVMLDKHPEKLQAPLRYYLDSLQADAKTTQIHEIILELHLTNQECTKALNRFDKMISQSPLVSADRIAQTAGYDPTIPNRKTRFLKLLVCLTKSGNFKDALRIAENIINAKYLTLQEIQSNPELTDLITADAFQQLKQKYPKQ